MSPLSYQHLCVALALPLGSCGWVYSSLQSKQIQNSRRTSTNKDVLFFQHLASTKPNDAATTNKPFVLNGASNQTLGASVTAAAMMNLKDPTGFNQLDIVNEDNCELESHNATTNPDSYSRLLQSELDLEREKTRLEGFEAYVLVSVLAASASFSFMGEFDFATVSPPSLTTITTFVAGLSAFCGLHATVVFSLCALYGKTALGLCKDDVYHYFLERVQAQRVRGFQAFSASLMLFAVEVGLVLYAKVPVEAQPLAALVACFGLAPIVADWSTIVREATCIFTGVVPTSSPPKSFLSSLLPQATSGKHHDDAKKKLTTPP